MYLKKLEICGFKSFARKTEVIFEKGVTCVVGPNGCGKSNISDSIRWVLGERSAKMLRGSKMEDVIFQGTDTRDPINFAEVTLTIDNADHALPIQFDEVSITRRLHRSGESEYLLNKTACRLKDIQNLILDTGVGSNSYSMIEQGRIDYILNAEAEERRFLIEEAAGISKYKVKKDEAIRKLDQTEQNLLRLNDIVSEVERNIKYAERQAKRAEQYKVHYDKLKTLELAQLSYEIAQLNEKKKTLSDERTRLDALTSDYKSQLAQLTEEVTSAQNKYREIEERYFKAEHSRIQFEQKLVSTQRERETTRERYHETRSTTGKNAEEIQKIEIQLQSLSEELKKKELEFSSISEVYNALNADKLQIESKLTIWHEEVNERSMKLFECREKSYEIASKIADLNNQSTKTKLDLQTLSERKRQLSDESVHIKEEALKIDSELARFEKEFEEIRLSVDSKSQHTNGVASERVNRNETLKRLFDQLNEQKERKFTFAHKLELIHKLDGASFTSVKEVLEKYKGTGGVFQTVLALLDLLEINEGYEVAAAAALAEFSKAVVAKDAKSAVQILEQIQSEGHHQISILVCDQEKMGTAHNGGAAIHGHPLIKTRLYDVIKVKSGYEPLFHQLLGDVYVIGDIRKEDIHEYEELSKKVRLVSQKGIFIGHGFQLSLRNGSPTPLRDFISREQEKARLKKDLEQIEAQVKETESEILRFESTLKQLESTLKDGSDELVLEQLQMSRLESSIRSLQEQKTRSAEELRILKEELHETLEEERNSQETLDALAEEIRQAAETEQNFKTELDRETKWVEARKLEREEKIVALTKAQTKLESHEEFHRKSEDSLALMRSTHTSLEKRLNDLREEQIVLSERIVKLESLSETLQASEKELQESLIQTSSEVSQHRQTRDRATEIKSSLEATRASLQEEFNQFSNESHVFEKKELEIDYQKNSAIERVRNTYHLEIQESELAESTGQGHDPEVTLGMIAELKKKVETFGTVNLLAIEEYSELKERFDFLNTQRKDLEDSKESLLEAIRKINRTTKQLFEDTFVKVRENFSVYFKLLFEGGTADLTLIDEQNPLESGIDIIARPPGKKPQHITLLSGGEKALTATALLFALFKVKPSPFCVLDEIDAPLDEANNERLVRMIREFVASTQFIIVTHSRKTISMADSLYGVTMEEAGISKLVSVKVSRDSWTIEHDNAKVQKELNAVIQ